MTGEPTEPRARRRASRAAGPAGDVPGATTTAVPVQVQVPMPSRSIANAVRPTGLPPRRAANTRGVAMIAGITGSVAIAVLGALVAVLLVQHRHVAAAGDRDQRFVDTAKQTVVNMYSYTQATVDDDVDRFINGTSGPFRDAMGGNADNLKAFLRKSNLSSEAVINAAALEGLDPVAGNASVLVATRVTVTDPDGVNKPSQPFRLRVIVHRDDAGNMTAYDLKYPEGGN
ncbi:mammalian cell entry protein [Mycobacterium sp. M1]|uniref:Mammalian cell entry protein n=1 Tax=Mycolicibacter acidiphilus TaxID=2835306 RepID=A0ABS5RNH7_9MYCO|nr:mammalian cell entry protein [Mycolicibacter acidiphilus]MBS9534469.1 mammalian cell entry protein [Mycolicibacter acidiphilus]